MNVVVFGSIPLATKILKYLLYHPQATVIGVVCQKSHARFPEHYFNEPPVYTVALQHELSVLDLEDLPSLANRVELDLGFSGRFDRILQPQMLALFRKGVINCHGGPLPQYRGVHANIHALINGETKFAGTLHYMDEGIDTGPIIARHWFDIAPTDTGYDVFCKTEQALWQLFLDNIDAILGDEDKATPQDVFIAQGEEARQYRKQDLESIKAVSWDMPADELWNRIRALDFPGREPARVCLNGRPVYLRTTRM